MDSTATAERYAADTWRTIGVPESPGVHALANRFLGSHPIVFARGRSFAAVEAYGGKMRVVVPDESDAARAHWQIGQALAEWMLISDGLDEAARRSFRAGLAAAIVLPRGQVIKFAPTLGAEEIARRLSLPLAASLLREAEVSRVPTVLLTARYIRARGDDAGRLPLERGALELLASNRGIGVRRYVVPEGVVLRLR